MSEGVIEAKTLREAWEQGLQQGLIQVAENMLYEGIDLTLVAKLTGLSVEKVNNSPYSRASNTPYNNTKYPLPVKCLLNNDNSYIDAIPLPLYIIYSLIKPTSTTSKNQNYVKSICRQGWNFY
ncbi:hypothetical protein IQ247_06130 [Plectonema cf. radiosum LEGE 06105]|uniref:Uncharacterized protein n=1 Tax=Plectonema cf. radiosum LEGE 06105 TaxID=945769 RepID=A0A8J7JTL3_9CYAN|nr:hypothetical protein [Plectonema radiosum]MBE9212290.1 hypothetical protein [Plectonema cf. radiosum LEGE 06105]